MSATTASRFGKEGSDKRRVFAVLHVPPIESPVRAAVVAEHRAKKELES